MALIDVCKNLDTVKIYDVFPAAAQKLADFIKADYPQIKTIEICKDIQSTVTDADVINVATSGAVIPQIDEKWLKEGVYMSLPASIGLSEDFMINRAIKVIDNWKMYEAWADELKYPFSKALNCVGTLFLDWIKEDKLKEENIINIGDIITGKRPGRQNEKEKIIFGMGGIPLYDVAWGYTIYQKALKMGLGTKLNLWDKPYLY